MINANNSSLCMQVVEATQAAAGDMFLDNISIFIYRIWIPVNSLFGTVGNGLSLAVMIRLSKTNKAFLLQTVLVSNDLVSCLSYLVYGLEIAFRMPYNLGPNWVHESSFLMRVAKFVDQFNNLSLTTGILLVLSTSFYQAYALVRPQKYKLLKHKRHVIGVSFVCLVLGISTSLHDYLQFDLHYCPELGMFYVTLAAVSEWFLYFELARLFTRLGSLLILCVMAGVVSVLYHKHQVEHQALTGSANQNAALDSKVLTSLLAVQAGTMLVGYVPLLAHYIVYALPNTFSEDSLLTSLKIADFAMVIGLTWNFVFYAFTSKTFRKTAREILSCKTTIHPHGN